MSTAFEWNFDLTHGQLDEDQIKEFIKELNERPLDILAKIAVSTGHIPMGIPARKDVLDALIKAKENHDYQ